MSDASNGTAETSPSEVRYQPLVIALAAGSAGIELGAVACEAEFTAKW